MYEIRMTKTFRKDAERCRKQTGSDTIQWIRPDEHLSYQKDIKVPMPTRADFMKRTLAYALFKQGILLPSSRMRASNMPLTTSGLRN